ncbi:RNA polymerase sigma factor [Sphingobacterium sp. SG20118]|uniref:RNA polymerase sigma factor n=1 Tax=Sphingobacterium sp. SG20118 TaxID=3367156 RepID=UPI0037DFC7B9
MTRTQFNTELVQHSSQLKMLARKFTTDYNEIDDLLQETYLKAVQYFNTFKDGSNFQGWLYTIMRNTFINKYRRMTTARSIVTVQEDISVANLCQAAIGNGGEGKLIMDDIQAALKALDKVFFVPFTMYHEGYKYDEIAQHLAIPVGTVKTRIHIARKRLKVNLANYEIRG